MRRWVALGAPCSRPGKSGRGNGALLDLGALARWRAGVEAASNDEVLGRLARALLDFYKRNSGLDEPAHLTLGIEPRKAAAYLALAFSYTARHITGADAELPPEIALLEETARGRAVLIE